MAVAALPDVCVRVQINRFVKDYRGCSHDINTVLHSFKRWPTCVPTSLHRFILAHTHPSVNH